MKRKYKSGSRFAFWRWSDVGHIVRLHLIQTPWFSIHLHWLLDVDPSPYLHDHPTNFRSIILYGVYGENRTQTGVNNFILRRWTNSFTASADDRHRICYVRPGTLTLSFHGPRRREWGYHTSDGWVSWREYKP
jgi:hypothetical protein